MTYYSQSGQTSLQWTLKGTAGRISFHFSSSLDGSWSLRSFARARRSWLTWWWTSRSTCRTRCWSESTACSTPASTCLHCSLSHGGKKHRRPSSTHSTRSPSTTYFSPSWYTKTTCPLCDARAKRSSIPMSPKVFRWLCSRRTLAFRELKTWRTKVKALHTNTYITGKLTKYLSTFLNFTLCISTRSGRW